MRMLIAGCALLVALTACTKQQKPAGGGMETGTTGSADTIVTQQKSMDTAVVSHDTSVSSDTTHKSGVKPGKDTVKKP